MSETNWRDADLSQVETSELHRICGILQCERMLFSRGPDGDAEADEKIATLEAEIAKRAGATP